MGSVLMSYAQVDFEFWFAAPYANIDHAPQWPTEYQYKVGGRPVYLRLATQDADADVQVTMPATGKTIANVHINANSTATVDLTDMIDEIQCSNTQQIVENKGIYIRSNALITAYYEIASVLNTDIFSLKGQNALGKEFYAPFQNRMVNDPYHNKGNGEEQPTSDYPNAGGVNGNHISDPAYSYLVIVATQNNTRVTVTPTTKTVGLEKGESVTVLLQRGQTYVVRAYGQNLAARMSGTHITSTKPIAVTVGDDSAYPDYFTKSGDCEDYIGDQIVPVSVIGKEYVVVQGQGHKDSGYKEFVTITATVDGTTVYVEGAPYGSTLNSGEAVSIELDPNDLYTHISATNPVYAFHVSGYQCEVAGALLPSVEFCTGSYKVGFVRTYGSENGQEFYMNLMVKGDGEHDFLLNGAKSNAIENASFTSFPINGNEWKVAQVRFSQSELPEGAYYIQNNTSLFHMGMMNSASHDWGDGQGYRLMGSMYGYFSRFSDNDPKAIIVNNNDTSITVVRGTKVSLLADGGYKFKWVGYMWNGHDWDLLDSPYYLDNPNVENPYAIIDGLGIYKYVATITSDCHGVVERSLLVKIVEPVDLNNVHDTVCYSPELLPDTDKSQYYDLYNLNDTIVGRRGLLTGFYVDHFNKFVSADTVIVEDAEGHRPNSAKMRIFNGSYSVVNNPRIDDVNSSSKIGYLTKTGETWTDKYLGVSGEASQKSVFLTLDVSEDNLTLDKTSKISFDIRYDSTFLQNGTKEHRVYVDMSNRSGENATEWVTTLPAFNRVDNQPDSLYRADWEHVEIDLDDYQGQLNRIDTLRIRVFSESWYNRNGKTYGYYIDNITYYTKDRIEVLNTSDESKNYTITDGDSLYAIVWNYFDVTRSDTTMVYLSVRNPGREKRMVQLADTCVTGSKVEEFDLTRYNYVTGGAMVATRTWYTDAAMKNLVENPEFVEMTSGEHVFYVSVKDECDETQLGTLTINVATIPEVHDATIKKCQVHGIGSGVQGMIVLDEERKNITDDTRAKVTWYKDKNYTQKIGGSDSKIPVADGTVFYAEVTDPKDSKGRCPSYATLTVNVTPVPAITFNDFEMCEDEGSKDLNASPAGGVYSGDGVSGSVFSPTEGAGTYKILYTITKDGCENFDSVNVTVNPKVEVTLVNTTGQLNGGDKKQAQLSGTVTPASGTYTYDWKQAVVEKNSTELNWENATLLESTNILSPKTKELIRPTYFKVNVTDSNTGCSGETDVLVDVYVPVEVKLDLTPVCAGTDVTIDAKRVGGVGPFTYEWTFDPTNTSYEKTNDSVVVLKNPTKDVIVKVTVTDNGGKTGENVATEQKIQTVYANPVITLADKKACEGIGMELEASVSSGTAPYESSWSGNTEVLTSSLTGTKAVVSKKTTEGTYYLTYSVEDKNKCKASKNVTAQVFQKPEISAQIAKQMTCVGDSVQFSTTIVKGSSVNAKYTWESQESLSALSATNISNPKFASNVYGSHRFKVIMTDQNSCKDTSDEVSIRVNPRPTVEVNPKDKICVQEGGIQISATPSIPGNDPSVTYSYEWTGVDSPYEPNPMLDVSTAGTKTVTVRVTSNSGCESAEATGTFVVNPLPIVDFITKDPTGCANDTITLAANASSTDVSYSWSSPIGFIGPDNTSSVKVRLPEKVGAVTPQDYKVELNVTDNKTTCKGYTSGYVTALPLPQVTIDGQGEVCAGGTQTLSPTVTFKNTPTYSIKWYRDTTQLSSTDVEQPTYTQTGTGVFTIGVMITDGKGCVGTDTIAIKGLELPKANAGEDFTVNWREDFELSGSASGGTPDYTYLWSPADSLITSPILQKPKGNLLETTVYTLTVTDRKSCSNSDEVIVTVIGQPLKVTIVQRDSLCAGETVTLEALPSGGTGDYRYKWVNLKNASTVISTEKTIDVAAADAGTYQVELSCVGEKTFDPTTDKKVITVYDNPAITIIGGTDLRVCQNAVKSIVPQVSGGFTPYSYEWTEEESPLVITKETYAFSNSQVTGAQTVTLKVTDSIGCNTILPITVNVDPLPSVTINDMAVCSNDEGSITAEPGNTGLAPFKYTWSGFDELQPQDNVAKFTIDTEESIMLMATVVITDEHGCQSSDDAAITIKPLPTLKLDPKYTVCAEADLTLDINKDGIPGSYTMEWVGGTGMKYITDQSVVTRSIFNAPKTGTYTLEYTITDDDYGCPRVDETSVMVYPAVKLADIPDQIACASTDLEITAKILEGNPTSYSWIGSVSPKNTKDTKFNFVKEGTYEVSVIAGDMYCSDEKVFNVEVKPNPKVDIDGSPIKEADFMSNVQLTGQIIKETTGPYTHKWTEPLANNIASGANEQVVTTGKINQTTDFIYQIIDKYGCVDSALIRLQTEMILPQLRRLCDGTEVEVAPNELVDESVVCLTDKGVELCQGESTYLIPIFISGNEESISKLSYKWTDDERNELGSDINLLITPTKPQTIYNLHVYNESTGFYDDVTFKVRVHQLPKASIIVSPEWNGLFYTSRGNKSDYLVVDGNPSSDEDVEFVSHKWTVSPEVMIGNTAAQRTNVFTTEEIKPLTLTYEVTDEYGCYTKTSRDIEIVKQPIPVIIGPNVCENTTATYSTNITYPKGSLYWWEVTGGTILGDPTASRIDVLWESTENTTITVNVYPKGDRDIEGEMRRVFVTPVPDIDIEGKTHVCVGEYANYEAINNIPSMRLAYSWEVLDGYGALTNISYPVSDMATIQWNKVGRDSVVLHVANADAGGSCAVTDTLPVFIHRIPLADFTYQATEDVYFKNEGRIRHTDSIFVDKEVTFTNTTKNADSYDFYWDFIGDGVYTENTKDAIYKYDEVGDFMVSLMVVENMWGCNNVVSKPLKVVPNPNCGMTFPNAFTPDLSENNTFYPVFKEGVLESGYELRIYNRWGTLLWSTQDIAEEWDGVYKGSISKQDVYVYQCKATCEDIDPSTGEHRILNIKGDVTIIR
ncbi:MAG: gliding motility-associated C-terminal domain-containing protein [Bacteroidales bacterium]|nr:gliding motility-associated C-terminal domain-containing protein [Bacteroidales bacterium]